MTPRGDRPQPPGRVLLLRWVAGIGAVTADALAAREGTTLTSARATLSAATRQGLLARDRPLVDMPALYVVTRAGLRACGLSEIEPSRVSPASARHMVCCAGIAAALERRFPDHALMGERELVWRERRGGVPLASVRLGPAGGHRAQLHRPDLVMWPVLAERGLPIAVEVELTTKAPRRLAEICRGWARARHIAGVLYLVPPAVERALARAVTTAQAGERIAIVSLQSLALDRPRR